jgi:Zn-finger protein
MSKLFTLNTLIEKAMINSSSMKYNFFSIMENNFYPCDFDLNQNLILEILPECFLAFFIFYSLINVFNDKTTVIFQYYK